MRQGQRIQFYFLMLTIPVLHDGWKLRLHLRCEGFVGADVVSRDGAAAVGVGVSRQGTLVGADVVSRAGRRRLTAACARRRRRRQAAMAL